MKSLFDVLLAAPHPRVGSKVKYTEERPPWGYMIIKSIESINEIGFFGTYDYIEPDGGIYQMGKGYWEFEDIEFLN